MGFLKGLFSFLDFSMAFGAFMPCRIMLQEDDNGDRWLHTMDMAAKGDF